LPFADFFKSDPMSVPIPKSSLMRPETLWVPERLAKALVRNGLGKGLNECLERAIPLRKSATSLAWDRPKAFEHYNSMEVQLVSPQPKEILLVDDVVKRGATFVGAANRLKVTFPRARIRAFAAMQTISSPEEFKGIIDPCMGNITLDGQETTRRP
jgi:hypothetical protein